MHKSSTEKLWQRSPELDARFAAATGRIRVMEERLLTDDDLRRLAEPRVSYGQRREILSKAGYSGDDSTEGLIVAARDEHDRLLMSMTEGTGLGTFLLLDLDYHNVKAIVRYLLLEQSEQRSAASRSQSRSESLVKEGGENIPDGLKPLIRQTAPTPPELVFDVLLDLMQGTVPAAPPVGVRAVFFEHMKKIVNAAGQGKEMAFADLTADRLAFEEMIVLAKTPELKTMRDFLLDYISILADGANLETILRVRRSKGTRAFLEEALVPGGKVSPEEAAELYGRPLEELRSAYSKSYIADEIDPLPEYETREEIRDFGLMRDRLLLDVAAIGKKATASGEVIMGYWLAKRMEIKNVRLITQARGRGVPAEDILPMIRPAYKGYRK